MSRLCQMRLGENTPEVVSKKLAPEPETVEFADATIVTGGSAAVVRFDDGVTKSPSLMRLAICGLKS